MSEPLSDIPADIECALRAAFPFQSIPSLAVVTGGLSGAAVLSFAIGGREYVLKRTNLSSPEQAAQRARGYVCLRLAAERGIAPKLLFLDEVLGISISERIVPSPPNYSPDAVHGRLVNTARALRRLHDGPAFPRGLGPVERVRQLTVEIRATDPRAAPDTLLETVARAARATERFYATAPCHLDLNPNNMLHAGDTVYFVDWDVAGQADPYLDLAQLGIFAFPAPALREALLDVYLGRPPNAEERARATVARVITLGCYCAAFTKLAVESADSARLAGPPLRFPDLLAVLAKERERISPGLVAGSLLFAMKSEGEGEAYKEALRLLSV